VFQLLCPSPPKALAAPGISTRRGGHHPAADAQEDLENLVPGSPASMTSSMAGSTCSSLQPVKELGAAGAGAGTGSSARGGPMGKGTAGTRSRIPTLTNGNGGLVDKTNYLGE
jgi:hypothetical protein